MDGHQPQAVEPATSATSGSDWQEREEGTEYTPEQLARKFLDSTWEQQVDIMDKTLENAGIAAACHMLNHDGAHIFATQHSCQPDRYQEGWEQGWKDAFEEMQKRVEALGK